MRKTDRLDLLELTSEDFARRLARLEARVVEPAAYVASRPTEPVVWSPFEATPLGEQREAAVTRYLPPESKQPADATAATAAGGPRRSSLEDLLGGRVLAWAGGLAVLVGIVLLFAVAVSRGWIGEGARSLFGALASSSLVVAGCWLHERRGRTDASLAATAAGLAGLVVTAVVAARVYELIPAELAVLLALGTAVLSTSLALRWQDHGLAALGILGGLLAPVLVGAPQDGPTTAILFTAALSAAAVCVQARWGWLALAACAIVTPQWIGYLVNDPDPLATAATLIGFGAVAAAGAVGFDLRERTAVVRPASVLLLTINAFLLAIVGWLALDQAASWLVFLAAVHIASGFALMHQPRASRAVGILAAGLGAVVADLALTQLLDGVALTVSWAVVAVTFAGLARHARASGRALDDAAAGTGLATHIALTLANAVIAGAPPAAIAAGGALAFGASGSLAALAAACLAAGLVLGDRPTWRHALNSLGLAATAYLIAANLDGVSLVSAWATQAVVLSEFARRTGNRFALGAALAYLALASAHALAFEAPPSALLDGLADPVAAAIALGGCAVAAGRCALVAAAARKLTPPTMPASHRVASDLHSSHMRTLAIYAATAGALLALHLASTQLVTAAGAGPRAQTLLSVLWGAIGVAALVGGLLRDVAPLRTGALTLLLAALAKVFLYDLAALTSIARVVSFIALGLLLLLAAFAWQRIRPRPLPDLREAAPGLRGS